MAFRSTSQFRFKAPQAAEARLGGPGCGRGASGQAARDRLSRASSNSRASISLRIADNRGSTACGSSASSFALSASIAAFSVSIILVTTASIRGGGGFHGIEITGHAGKKSHWGNRPLRPRPHSRTLPPNNFAINPPHIGQRPRTPQNYITAYMWFNLAAAQTGNDELRHLAAKSRDDIGAKMTPAEIAEAQRVAREWKPK
jgi:hypothetical protein